MEDDSDNLAFRRVVVCVAERLTKEELRKLIYLRLYRKRDTLFRRAENLEVMAALETAGVFGPARPEDLLEILEKDLGNRQLANLVKVFLRDRKKKTVGGGSVSVGGEAGSEGVSRVRLCYKLAVSRTNVLVKHLEALRLAAGGAGGRVDALAARSAVENISETAAALAMLREKTNEELIEEPLTISETAEDQPDCGRKTNVIYSFSLCIIEEVNVCTNEDEEVSQPLPSPPTTAKQPTPPQPPRHENLPVLKPKPAPKTKPKLKKKHPRYAWDPRNANSASSGFNSSRSSSVPHLLYVTPSNTDEGEGEEEEDYIDPEEAITDSLSKEAQQIRSSRLLKKTTSLISFNNSPSANSSGRKLPAPLKRLSSLMSRHHSRVSYVLDFETLRAEQSCDTTEGDYAEVGEHCGPIYEEISAHTLLSRVGKTLT